MSDVTRRTVGLGAACLGLTTAVVVLLATVGSSEAHSSSSAILGEASGKLQAEYAITATPTAGGLDLPVSAEEATTAARAAVGAVEELPAGEPVLVRFTDEDYGEATDADSGDIRAYFADQEAWMISFEGAEMPIFGGFKYEGPTSYETTVVAFVDGHSGEFIEAVTI